MSTTAPSIPETLLLAAQAASGQRPEFTGDPLIERLFGINLALATELIVTRERLDTLERLLEAQQVLPRSRIDAYKPDAAIAEQRARGHQEYLSRIFRVLLQDSGAAGQ